MAFLTPDKIRTEKIGNETITIKVKITPDSAVANKVCGHVPVGSKMKPFAKLAGTGKPKGITVHNTEDIVAAAGTNPAEQYARGTWPNCNMGGVCVHFWVWKNEIWQQLDESEQGWHAADGSTRRSSQRTGETIGGNLDTISIECIGKDPQSEDTTAKLVAYLLKAHGLSPDTDVYTHSYFYAKKYCPAYILPHWGSFMGNVKKYYGVSAPVVPTVPIVTTPTSAPEAPATGGKLYRVQVGSFSTKANAEAMLSNLKKAGFDGYIIYS